LWMTNWQMCVRSLSFHNAGTILAFKRSKWATSRNVSGGFESDTL
jgi:hypothetical protein